MNLDVLIGEEGVPFEEMVFVRYPVVADPYDANRVAPDDDAAEQLWAALEANQSLQLTSDPNTSGGVITADPAPTETPVEGEPTEPVEPTEGAAPVEPDPTETAAVLPESIQGQPAAQETCSAGNLAG